MKESFLLLPEERQNEIINAGFDQFSCHSYWKCPVGRIAEQAHISKSLLFYYFKDKKELYMTLWNKCVCFTASSLQEEKISELPFFDMLEKGLHVKMELLRKYPSLSAFAIRAYYENDERIRPEVQATYQKMLKYYRDKAIRAMNPEEFREGVDLSEMYQMIYYASEGYLYEKVRSGKLDADEIEEEYHKMMQHWKGVYGR